VLLPPGERKAAPGGALVRCGVRSGRGCAVQLWRLPGTAWTPELSAPHHSRVRVAHIKKLDDCFGQFTGTRELPVRLLARDRA
jgi:hypothetical protein